jgi:lipopolysaccharide biosynthesis protein
MAVWQIVSGLAARVRGAVAGLVGWSAFALSVLDRRSTILASEPGDDATEPLGPRVVVFCHFDRQGRVREHTRAYMEALCGEGLAMIFVSNSARLAPPDLAWVRGRAARIVLRRNVGYDFAAWRDAMTSCGLPAADTHFLLLANDSVYGPLRPLGPAFQRIDFGTADVWGATDSWQHRFHLQSYFIAFGPKALASEAFGTFWKTVRTVRSKGWVVTRYELGLSRTLIAAGLRCRALWPYTGTIEALRESVASREENRTEPARDPFTAAAGRNEAHVLDAALRHLPLNPTADLWRALIEQGFPFLKRELLRDNPSRVPGIAAWLAVIRGIGTFDADIILHDLERISKNRSP